MVSQHIRQQSAIMQLNLSLELFCETTSKKEVE
jgi:hypothetical protein